MSTGQAMFSDYLRKIGMSGPPVDAAQQLQLTMIRQWIAHLEDALREEGIDPAASHRVIRSFIYGAVPQRADAELRRDMTAEHVQHLMSCSSPSVFEEQS